MIETFSTFQVVVFLLIDFVFLASIVAGIFFLVLFLKTRKQKNIKVVNLNDLDAFKNKNLSMETNISMQQNRPVAPSTIHQSNGYLSVTEQASYTPPPMRSSNDGNQRLFNCQMQETQRQMNDTFIMSQQNNTNYFNM